MAARATPGADDAQPAIQLHNALCSVCGAAVRRDTNGGAKHKKHTKKKKKPKKTTDDAVPLHRQLLKCTGCLFARYCSSACQRQGWNAGGHKKVCKPLKAILAAEDAGQLGADPTTLGFSPAETTLCLLIRQRVKELRRDASARPQSKRAAREAAAAMAVPESNASAADISAARQLNDEAKERFLASDYEGAAAKYSAAISLDPANAIYYSNRASCWLKLKKFSQAEKDLTTTVAIRPAWYKGFYKLAQLEQKRERWQHAMDFYSKVADMIDGSDEDPGTKKRIKKAIAQHQKKINVRQGRMFEATPTARMGLSVSLSELYDMHIHDSIMGQFADRGVHSAVAYRRMSQQDRIIVHRNGVGGGGEEVAFAALDWESGAKIYHTKHAIDYVWGLKNYPIWQPSSALTLSALKSLCSAIVESGLTGLWVDDRFHSIMALTEQRLCTKQYQGFLAPGMSVNVAEGVEPAEVIRQCKKRLKKAKAKGATSVQECLETMSRGLQISQSLAIMYAYQCVVGSGDLARCCALLEWAATLIRLAREKIEPVGDVELEDQARSRTYERRIRAWRMELMCLAMFQRGDYSTTGTFGRKTLQKEYKRVANDALDAIFAGAAADAVQAREARERGTPIEQIQFPAIDPSSVNFIQQLGDRYDYAGANATMASVYSRFAYDARDSSPMGDYNVSFLLAARKAFFFYNEAYRTMPPDEPAAELYVANAAVFGLRSGVLTKAAADQLFQGYDAVMKSRRRDGFGASDFQPGDSLMTMFRTVRRVYSRDYARHPASHQVWLAMMRNGRAPNMQQKNEIARMLPDLRVLMFGRTLDDGEKIDYSGAPSYGPRSRGYVNS